MGLRDELERIIREHMDIPMSGTGTVTKTILSRYHLLKKVGTLVIFDRQEAINYIREKNKNLKVYIVEVK